MLSCWMWRSNKKQWDCKMYNEWNKIAKCWILNWYKFKLNDWSWQLQLKLRLLSDCDER